MQFLPVERDWNNEEAAGDHLMVGQGRCASAYRWNTPREKPNGGWGLINKTWGNEGTMRKHAPGVGVEKVTQTWDENENVILEWEKRKDVREVGSEIEPTLNNLLWWSDLIPLRAPCFQRVCLTLFVKTTHLGTDLLSRWGSKLHYRAGQRENYFLHNISQLAHLVYPWLPCIKTVAPIGCEGEG